MLNKNDFIKKGEQMKIISKETVRRNNKTDKKV